MTRKTEQILGEWLVLQAQSGNRAAVNALARHWYPLLHRYACKSLGAQADADDAVQETLEQACRRIGTVRDPAAFAGWVYRILHRRCMDQLRQKSRYRSSGGATDSVMSKAEDDAEPAYTPKLSLERDLHGAIRQLAADSYQIIHLHYLHGLSVQEMAEILDLPAGTIKSRLFTARDKLKTLLRGYQHE